MSNKREMVYLCLPCYGGVNCGTARQFWLRPMRSDGPYAHMDRIPSDSGSSLLGNGFDTHWTTALNMQQAGYPITRFAMLHSDIVPMDWWLDTLLEDLDKHQADVMAAVVPIKDLKGLTSTAIDDPKDQWDVLRRLTMTEVSRLPEVFSSADCRYPDNLLLANTGCWVCDFTKDWRYYVNFEIRNRIAYKTRDGETYSQELLKVSKKTPADLEKEGNWITQVAPEDWEFSRKVGRLGGKVLCTKRVILKHVGEFPFPNHEAWGSYLTDEVFSHKFDGNSSNGATVSTNFEQPSETHSSVEVPPEIEGWLTEEEGRFLAHLAKDRVVLEIGSYCGLSTVWMARVAKYMDVVDTFDGRGTPNPRNTLEEFRTNLTRYGVADKVVIHVCEGANAWMIGGEDGENSDDRRMFDLAFIDGAHDKESIQADINLALRTLKPGGLLAFHDYGDINFPDVSTEVHRQISLGAEIVDQKGSIVVLQPPFPLPAHPSISPQEISQQQELSTR